MTTAVVVDDQDLVRAGFRLILAHGDPPVDVVGEASDGQAAVELVAKLQPDVVLMDLRMPVLDGVQATRAIVASGSTSRVLVLTTFDTDEHVYEAFQAGASGFLLKNAGAGRLVEAVHAVAAGEELLAPDITRRLIQRFLHRQPQSQQRLAPLTEREREVLTLIGRGRSNQEIAAALHLSTGTVKTHVTHILTKLDLRDRVQAVVLAFETGLVSPSGG